MIQLWKEKGKKLKQKHKENKWIKDIQEENEKEKKNNDKIND